MPDASRPAVPGAAARLASVWYRHWRVYSDTFFANATPAVFEPLFLLLAVGVGVGRYIEVRFNGLGYDEFMAPGVLGMTALYTAAYEGTYATFVRLRYQHTYQTMLATPLTLRDVFRGEILWCASKGVLYTTIVAAVLGAVGATSSWWTVLCPVAGFLTALAFAGLSFLVTSVVRNMNHFQFFFTAGLTPMVFFSGLMFPVQDLPGVLPYVAYATPMFHCIETFRLLTSGPAHASVTWFAWCPAVLAVYAIVLAFLGVRAMERRLRA